ncbi:class I SAM-dependent methyltransferase [Algirhabdus cladophorae]|uniref:class I SAM-dependent methyltransferase n=1 Tax=Algirhabdus cladophorae TaxID=3377108 RepID=UPI003B84B54F
MTLSEVLIQRIAAHGPITIADYMTDCLQHPQHGYYITRDPLGAAGDFITAPEISQMFGELIGLSLAQTWMDQDAPSQFVLAELGPGRGTLIADVIRATRSVPGFAEAAQMHLIETSPPLRAAQAQLLGDTVTWHETVTTLPEAPLYCIANEFFDALPIRQFQRRGAAWCERVVGVKDDALHVGLTQPAPLAALEARLDDTKDGDLVELAPAAPGIIGEISHRIEAFGGAGLIIDYGDWGSQGDTLQAVQDHTFVDPFAQPGAADLTAHVDFEALAIAATCAHSRLTPQGVYLERLGITGRAQQLAAKLSGNPLEQHINAHRRLTHPSEMGTLFKVMGLMPHHAAAPAGLET